MKLHVMDIQRFALHDGPGIRTTVFLQGCSLRCPWCANPEGWRMGCHLMYVKQRCVGCGRCAAGCPTGAALMEGEGPRFDREQCIGCGRCVESCLPGALRLSGKAMDIADIVAVLLRDKSYYRHTGGGITLSGGEPFTQPEGALELLRHCKAQGLHTAVETTGHAPSEGLMASEPFIDLFLYDIKHTDAAIFSNATKGDLNLALKNLALLPPEKVVLRVSVIPGFNHSKEVIRDIFELALRQGVSRASLLPYHVLGKGKYEQLGLAYAYPYEKALTKNDLSELKAMGEGLGLAME
jgi:pyruvate formate lyase activating enzyme